MKKKLGILLCMSILISSTLPAFAAGSYEILNEGVAENVKYKDKIYTYAVTKEYSSDDKDKKYGFDQTYDKAELKAVVYELIDETGDTVSVSREYRELMEKDESAIDAAVTENGITYELVDVSWQEEPYMETVTGQIDYGYQVTQPVFDNEMTTSYTSGKMKKTVEVRIPFKNMEVGDYSWHEGFKADMVFKNLSGVFNLSGTDFYYDDSSLELSENDFKVLVDKLGYDNDRYRLDSAKWVGDEYTSDGQRYRNAAAYGRIYSARYIAHYEGQAETGKLYTATAVYTAETNIRYSIRATGYYQRTGVWTNVITFVTKHKELSAGFLFIILAAGFAAAVVILKKKEEAADVASEEEGSGENE